MKRILTQKSKPRLFIFGLFKNPENTMLNFVTTLKMVIRWIRLFDSHEASVGSQQKIRLLVIRWCFVVIDIGTLVLFSLILSFERCAMFKGYADKYIDFM